MTAAHPPADEFTELRDAEIDRVDLVGKAANGTRFLIAKAAQDGHLTAPLVPAGMVRELLAKAESDPAWVAGSLAKADASTETINDHPDSDFAYIEPGGSKDDTGKTTPRSLRHFPIYDAAHIRNALARAPQSPFGDKAMPAIRAAAKRFGIDTEVTKTMPDTDTAPAGDVTKDAPPVEVDEIMPAAPGGSTAESLPGSPDWEQLDGDTAMNAVAVLGRVKSVLCWLSDREATEAVTGDGDADADGNSWDLDSMACSVDYIISCLAGFAAGEHLEAGMADELEAVGKAVAAVAAPLAALEGFVPVAKAGRTLSAANETKIRTAVDSLTEVLNSLPAAPAADDGAAVTKETAVPEQTAPEAPAVEPVDVLAKALAALPRLDAAQTAATLLAGGRVQEVAKAKGDPQMAVFSADGKLVGVIDPADLNPIAATEAPSEGDTEGSGDDTAEPAAEAPADDTAAPAEPTDDASRVVPGTSTVQAPPQAPDDTQTPAVAKTAADPAALEERVAALTKQVENLVEANGELKEQVRKFGLQPDDRRSPVLNGATGAGTATRDGSGDGNLADLRKAVDEAKTHTELVKAKSDLAFAEIKARFQG